MTPVSRILGFGGQIGANSPYPTPCLHREVLENRRYGAHLFNITGNYPMNESKIIKALNGFKYNFKPMDDKFSRYDAFDEKNGIMLEIKCRHKHYPDTIIEKMKFDWNKEFAKEHGFEFWYAVSMPEKAGSHTVYVFDPANLEGEEEGYDFKWHIKKLPQNTEFKGSKWIDKEVGYLHIDDCLMCFTETTTH